MIVLEERFPKGIVEKSSLRLDRLKIMIELGSNEFLSEVKASNIESRFCTKRPRESLDRYGMR